MINFCHISADKQFTQQRVLWGYFLPPFATKGLITVKSKSQFVLFFKTCSFSTDMCTLSSYLVVLATHLRHAIANNFLIRIFLILPDRCRCCPTSPTHSCWSELWWCDRHNCCHSRCCRCSVPTLHRHKDTESIAHALQQERPRHTIQLTVISPGWAWVWNKVYENVNQVWEDLSWPLIEYMWTESERTSMRT